MFYPVILASSQQVPENAAISDLPRILIERETYILDSQAIDQGKRPRITWILNSASRERSRRHTNHTERRVACQMLSRDPGKLLVP